MEITEAYFLLKNTNYLTENDLLDGEQTPVGTCSVLAFKKRPG